MTAQETTPNEIVTFEDLKYLARARGPCITIVFDLDTPFALSTKLKNAMRAVEKSLAAWKLDAGREKSLLEPIHEIAQTVETAGIWSSALILFRSPDLFRCFLLHRREPDRESVAERFQVGPLLEALAREQRFHVLGLSRRRIRLLQCTQYQATQAGLDGFVPTNLNTWLNTREPDHDLVNRSTGGPAAGSMKGVTFGTSTDREHEYEYVAHFFKAVDHGVNALLRGKSRLLLAGVEEELAIYRRVSAYPRLFGDSVHGSPDAFSDAELHKRAMDIVMRTPSEALKTSLDHFEQNRDSHHVSSDARELIRATWEGRVSDLFLSSGAEFRGTWNPETLEADTNNSREDLLNAAALQTVLTGGQAFALARKEVPLEQDATAVLRF